MDLDTISRTTGSVVLQVGALELLARYSNPQGRATSVLSSLHEFRTREVEQTGGQQWNWKYLRDQFDQKDLEGLYRKYDDKLRDTLLYIYLTLLLLMSTVHIIIVIVGAFSENSQNSISTYITMGMFLLRITIPTFLLAKFVYKPLVERCFCMPMLITVVIAVDLVFTDVLIAIIAYLYEGILLRPAYVTLALLSIYIFLPLRNNFIVIILGIIISTIYTIIYGLITYVEGPVSGRAIRISSDVIYLTGVNIMGVYFRLMNEIVTRRSFLDRRACVESTLRLKFVKDQEERLMLSILPEHIVSCVRKDIRNMFMGLRTHSLGYSIRAFNQLYVEEHENVSILYADVVNYTMISTTLSPMRMVELLNELFGRFDEASEEQDVLRIKFLGDCYYCVSGIPNPTPLHAKNCVDLGLEMIYIIKDVREKRSLDINMRIGVHSGRILSGLIGIRKWQFDVWSKDVTIASKMEQTGEPGKVHVTKQTLELLLDYAREYIIEPNFQSQNDTFIKKNKLETYLLSRPTRMTEFKPFRRASVGFNKILKKGSRRSENRSSINFRKGTTFMDENLVEYQQMLKAADAQMAKEIENMTNGKDHFVNKWKLNRFILMYENFKKEIEFQLIPDPLFKYYITCCLLIFILISIINGLTTKWYRGFHPAVFIVHVVLCIMLICLQPLTWFQFFWTKYVGIDEPQNKYLRKIYDISVKIISSAKIRAFIYLLISSGLAAISVLNVTGCVEMQHPHDPDKESRSNCASPWHVTQCWGLALLLNFLFSRVFFVFKWFVASVMTAFYLWVVWEVKSTLFLSDTSWNQGLDPRLAHTLAVAYITLTLYFIDRTTEYRNRLDHLWQMQLNEEQQEAETMLRVNNMLLENILPAHVVQIYLDLNRSIDELYYEKYDNVAVMFASLTDYKLGVEDDAALSDKFMLSIMDEVISDFDRLLMAGASVYKVEKIKMAGWTYMAACGLDPNRRDSSDTISYGSLIERRPTLSSLRERRPTFGSVFDKRQNTPYNNAIVLTMVEFAAAMMMQLQNFNRGSFQRFEGLNLRIGISNGEVAAGVVGSLKPLYDIWGHAVNMASRMDSTGISGKIQVTENTAIILDDCGILTKYRGEIFVKGAGYVRTYLVPLDENFNLIRKEVCHYRIDRISQMRNSLFRSVSEVGDYEPAYRDSISSFNNISVDSNGSSAFQARSISNSDSSEEEEDVIDTRC